METLKKVNSFFIICLLSIFFLFPIISDARSGCCSWHGGVSYCDTTVGRYVCNDGTYSPSCGCYKKPVISKVSQIKSEIEKARPDYYRNPHWFRENLINKLKSSLSINFFTADYDNLTYYIYSMLPDVK